VRIRRASPEEAAALTQIAQDAKRHWGYPEHWIQHWQSQLTISPDFITHNQVYLAEHESEIVGFYALVLNGERAELEHMWVAPAHIGAGIGKELFVHAMQQAAGENVSAVEISSDPNAAGFYERMGARRIGEVPADMDGQPRVVPRMSIDPST
jgi:GNAT superfamily N-acetyltransferase